ncbi:MAG: anaerobic ribonucleoside-triphosphate reductase activating protein [Candidatus Magasanikbacteria bacterium CG10_big_fil_rev_8_21_14_0_10_36_32]|uniref:Anaerobic ribonucleoside-triphosphate reductase activating protein n=1 Tax=Candidatus Magasanikbacteria bacterium CG10_big_fil_rev_8_21_14_0_10_36_32 TaxID=1974646 RepID=A0A2M6W795_9BACT|nr:MAG: anaerobic ribonucleoside-triphosphate reductase activating protein [Candidatus Magasanikbacteria bacterium CG10_big_fil_rev_8_21_14_0_10_36_32]
MIIGGWQKFSLIDYPGKVSAVIFTQGCRFRCPFCHNPELVVPEKFTESVSIEEVLNFLNSRKNQLDGIVISGGEPTVHSDLPDFISQIKKLGFLVKIDTNGSCPDNLEYLIKHHLVDYVAMDIKSPLFKYKAHTNSNINEEHIKKSIEMVKNSGLDYEFRTTVVKEQLSPEDLFAIGQTLSGSKRYILQKFIPRKTLNEDFMKAETYTDEEFDDFCLKLKTLVEECFWR